MVKLYRNERRRRRRAFWSVLRSMLLIGVLAGLAGFVFYQGMLFGDKERLALAQEVDRLKDDLSTAKSKLIGNERDLSQARTEVEDWTARYEADVPQGDARVLYDAVRERLAAGIPGERIAFLLKAAEKERVCDPTLVTARFGVLLAGQDSLTRPVAFGKGRVRVSVSGQSREPADGIQRVYDPEKPVTISVTDISGAVVKENGILPLRASLVAGASEYRFLVEPETNGLVSVTAERCNYP